MKNKYYIPIAIILLFFAIQVVKEVIHEYPGQYYYTEHNRNEAVFSFWILLNIPTFIIYKIVGLLIKE